MHGSLNNSRFNDILPELRKESLSRVLLAAALVSWVAILVGGLFVPNIPITAVPLWLAFEAICIVVYWLKPRDVRLSIYLLILGLCLGSIAAVFVFSSPVFLYLSSSIPLLSSMLLRRRSAFVITVLASAGMIGLPSISPAFHNVTGPVIMWWLVLFSGFAAFDSLYRALQIALDYQSYAIDRLEEVRLHRAELMQLAKALQETQQNLEKSNIQLRHISLAAEEARRLKAQFAANVSHELRTPINMIIGFAEMIIAGPRSYGEALPSVYWVDINTIYRNAKHLQSLINDVLDISQIEAGRMAVVKENIDPRSVILDATALVSDTIRGKGLELVVQVPDELPKACIDRLRIRQVILNLLGNAIRFTDQGQITVQAFIRDASLHICVADTGIGIPPHELDRVFEEFHQIEGSLARRYGGSGLGLSLSKQFVELHGGRLWVESDGMSGPGSQFWLTVPLEASPAWAVALQDTPPMPFTSEERYFIVLDDDPVISQLFERHTAKHRAIGVRSADEARHLIERIFPSALVVDAESTAANSLADALAGSSDLPIIRCSMPSGQRYMKSIGIARYLAKPISPEALESALRSLDKPIQTILVVNDDQHVVRLYSRILQSLSTDYQVRKAYSGIEALEIMRRSPPDVLILDLLMSGISGSKVIEQMKSTPALESVPIILASDYGAADAIVPAMRGEIHLDKPQGFRPVELVRCVEALIDAITPSSDPISTKVPAGLGVS